MRHLVKRFIILCLFSVLAVGAMQAQETQATATPELHYIEGREYFEQGYYSVAQKALEQYMLTADKNSDTYMQASYYYVACMYYQQSPKAIDRLTEFVNKYPYAPLSHQCYFMLGRLYFDKKNYKRTLAYYDKLEDKDLNKEEATEYKFTKAYALLQQGKSNDARSLFDELYDGKTRYATDSYYYVAYIDYLDGDYDKAEKAFDNLDNTSYEEPAKYHLLQIYERRGEYQKAIDLGEKLIMKYPDSEYNTEAYRILGEAAYKRNAYNLAKNYLMLYSKSIAEMPRTDNYILGVCCYKTGDNEQAITYLQKSTELNDTLSQSAWLNLGHAYRKTNNLNQAKMAYQNAASMSYNAKAREEALYNYAVTTYETKASFKESNGALNRFVEEYPRSKHCDEIYTLITNNFLREENYAAAYNAIQRVKIDNPKMREVKEHVYFEMGVRSFRKNNYEKAKDFFNQSIALYNKKSQSAQAYLWRAETNYRLQNYGACRQDIETYLKTPQTRLKESEVKAYYTMGYSYFDAKNYKQALPWFQKYLDKNTVKDAMYIDALNRVGDCSFNARNFAQARKYYQQAVAEQPKQADYAAYQNAFIYGLQKQYRAKITAMEDFLKTYPRSAYVPAARYEIGRSYVMCEEYPQAIIAYNNLIETSPKSKQARTAAIEIGMLHTNLNQTDKAIAAYKKVVNDYPATEEAMVAMESLEALYVDRNEVDKYVTFRNSVPQNVVTSLPQNSEDSLTFAAAERLYAKNKLGDAADAFNKYINKYCKVPSALCANAYYYMADCYYRQKQYSAALEAYDILIKNFEDNNYIELALTRAAQMAYDANDYAHAVYYFEQLQDVTADTIKQRAAQVGTLRCYFKQKNYEKTIDVASSMLYNSALDSVQTREAQYCRAKSMLMLKDYDRALPDLRALSSDLEKEFGAEAKFYTAGVYFTNKRYADAENELLDFIDKGTSQEYWLARGFVLLADVYIAQKDDFQAKQYLVALQENYTGNDEIKEMVKTRLNGIKKREVQKK